MDSTQSTMSQGVIVILWNGESGSPVLTFLELRWCPWKPSSMAETEKLVLSTLPCSPSCVSLGLGPELFCYLAPLDCLVTTLLPQCLLVVGQRKACSSWKSVLEGSTGRPGVAVLRCASLSLLSQALQYHLCPGCVHFTSPPLVYALPSCCC